MRTDKRFSKKAPPRAPKRGVVGFSKKTALLEEAVTQMNAGKYGRSSAVLKELLALDPQNLDARRLFATLHLRLGSLMTARAAFESLAMEALQRQDYWLAESLLREYLAAGPRCVPFLELLGHVYEEKGDPMAAVAEYGKAIEVLVEDPDPDRPQRAAELYAKIRELAPASPVAFRLAPMFDARTGELAVTPHVHAPGESADGSETQSNVSPLHKEISQNDASICLPWETAEDEAKSASGAEGESDGSPVVENSQESTSSPACGSSEDKRDEGRSVPVAFASQGVAACDSKRVGSTPAAEDTDSLPTRGDESLLHDTVLTADAQPTAPAREELAGYELPSPVDETTSPPVATGFSTGSVESQDVEHATMAQLPGSSFIVDEPISGMPVLEATTHPPAGADILAAPMPWEQVEENTVAIAQPEPVADDSAQQEAEAAPPIDGAVQSPPPRESDAEMHAEIRKLPSLEWETPTAENGADASSGPEAGERASPAPMVAGTEEDSFLPAPMPWERVEETTESIPQSGPETIETREVASIADVNGPESTIGWTGEERADAGGPGVDEPDLTEGTATASQPEATKSGPPATKQKTKPAPILEPQPFSLKPEPEADSSFSEPLRELEPAVESVAHEPEEGLSSEKAGPKIVETQVKESLARKESIEGKAAAAPEFRLKEKADGGVEATELPPATKTASQERRDLEARRHADEEGPSADREVLPPLELPVGGGVAVEPQDRVFVPEEEPIRFVSAEPTGTAPRSRDLTAEWTPMTPPSTSAAGPHDGTACDTTSAHRGTESGKGIVSAVDVLFGGSEGRAAATPSPVSAPRKSRGWLSLTPARLRLSVVTFVRSGLATTHSLVMSLLMLTVIGVAGLAVGVGLVGLAWIVMEEQPSNAFHNLSSTPERTVLDPGKNGYLLLLGFDADPLRDPVQAGYERKFTAADLELSKSCTGGDGGTTLAVRNTASTSAVASWFRTSDPAALFRNQAGGIRTWIPQYETSLERYRRWLKMPFEDWGYGQLVSPNCSAILAAHRLYVAEGFSETVEAGIMRLEGDLAAWRTALAQAKTLPIKMMAADAINDDVAVISGLLTRLDLEEKFVPQLMKMVRPLDQVEQSLRWPVQSQFVIASKASDPGLKREKQEDRPFYVSIVAAMPLPKQKRLNAYAEYYEAAMKNGEGLRAFSPKLYAYVRTPPQSWFDYLLNPIDNVVGLEPLPPWDLYSGRVLETDARLRLASLQAWIKQGPQGADLLARIAKAGQSFYDPFTGLPMLLSVKKNLLYSVGKDGKDDDGDPRLDVTVLIPRSIFIATPESRRAAASKSK